MELGRKQQLGNKYINRGEKEAKLKVAKEIKQLGQVNGIWYRPIETLFCCEEKNMTHKNIKQSSSSNPWIFYKEKTLYLEIEN